MGIRDVIGRKVVGVGEAIKPGEEAPAEDAPPVFEASNPPWWNVLLTFVGAAALLGAGILVLDQGRDIWVQPSPANVSPLPTKETSKYAKHLPKAKKFAKNWARPQTFTHERTIERASQSGGRSEGLALAILATGAALLLAGGFAARLKSIKLPGGVELVVAAYEGGFRVGSKYTAKAAVTAKKKGEDAVLESESSLVEAAKTAHARVAAETPGQPAAMGVLALDPIDRPMVDDAVEEGIEKAAKTAEESRSADS